jgi:hypothetical protein
MDSVKYDVLPTGADATPRVEIIAKHPPLWGLGDSVQFVPELVEVVISLAMPPVRHRVGMDRMQVGQCEWRKAKTHYDSMVLALVHLLEELFPGDINPLFCFELLKPQGSLSAKLVKAGFTTDHHSQCFPDNFAGIFIKPGGDFLVDQSIQGGGEFDLHHRSDVKAGIDCCCELRVPR